MRLTFRTKLMTIVVVDALALIVLILTSSLMQRRVGEQLDVVRERYLPRVGLGPRLDADFERIGRSVQDASTAGEVDDLDQARRDEAALLDAIDRAGPAIAPGDVAALHAAIDRYTEAAIRVSRRLIAGDSGADLDADTRAMQGLAAGARDQLDRATAVDADALASAFARTEEVQDTAQTLRYAVSAICMASIIGLTAWIGRGVLRDLARLSAGLRRFGDGDFARPIARGAGDELGEVAASANQMAARLRSLVWQQRGHAGVIEHLHGDLEPAEVARRAVVFLAEHFGATAAAIHYTDPDGVQVELARVGGGAATPSALAAAIAGEQVVVSGDDAGSLALAPLLHLGQVVGVLELALPRRWSDDDAALIGAVRESVTIAIEVARARAATRALLAKTQRQSEELTRASAVKSQFLASMSHELRTPLNAIIGFSELLRDGAVAPDSPQHAEFLDHIVTSGRHLLQLVNDILDLSKVEAGRLEFHPEPVRLTVVIEEVLGILRTSAAAAGLRVESSVDLAIDDVLIDPARLKQVLYNLVSNAIKFTPRGGRVEICASTAPGERFRLEVEDSGIGIAAEHLGRLFGEFEQIGGAARRAGGTGLGLALTRRLVEAQGGTVGVRSEVGKGSVFEVVLPRLTSGELAAPRRTLRSTRGPSRADVPVLLVIEDNPVDQSQLAGALVEAGYQVEMVSSGAEAVARARERRFDAITLDLLLPDMSGLEVLRHLRTDSKNRDVPVVVITVVAEPGSVAGFAVSDILPKPVDKEALLDVLLRAGVAPSAARAVMVVDDDDSALQLMARMLEQLGYRSRCERDGRSALDSVRRSVPIAIVLDLLMPGMSGFEFLDELRTAPHGRDIPVIVWTSKDLSPHEHTILRASASAVVSKGSGGSERVLAELASHLPARSS